MMSWSKRRLSVRTRRIATSSGWWQPGNRCSPSRCVGEVLLVFATLLAIMPAPARAQGSAPSATYRVTFEGTWTSSVTPGGVVSNAHFSPLIGAVHDGGAIFWSRGGRASAGIEQVAETGRTTTFRSEILASPNAVAVVEQQLPNGPTPTATVEFTVTNDHPLVTLVAMIAPSPDWFVGVSGLSLLDARGQWRAQQQVDLFPYDAGTEEGTEFALDNPATSPQETITSIRGTGKFSNEPIARLTFELQSPVAPASITLSVDPERVLEGAGATPVTVTASLDGSVRTEDTAVTVSVSGSGAAGVVGFAAVAAFDVTIPAGASHGTGTFTVTPEDDAVDEMDERIDVRGTSSLEVTAATLILVDDDDPPVSITLSVDPERVLEGAGATPVTVTASLDGSVRTEDTAVTVSVSGSGAAGVVGFAAVAAFDVMIPAGASHGTGTFTVTPEDDAVDEMDERIDVRGTSSLEVTAATLILVDDDDPPVSITLSVDPERVLEGAGATPVTVTASLDGSVRTEDTAVTVSVAGSGAAGVVGFAAVAAFDVTIPAGASHGTGTFTVTPEDDAVDEMDERIDVRGTASLEVHAAALILVDDDDPPVSITLSVDPERVLEGAGATPVTVTASLDGSVRTEDTAVTVSVSGSGAAGVVGFAAVAAFDVTIPAAASSGTGTFTVTPEDDAVDEMDERVDVRGESTLVVQPAALILADDDDPSTSIALSLDRERVAEDAGAATVTVTATLDQSARTEDTVVTVAVSGSGTSGVVGFAAVDAFDVLILATMASGAGTFVLTPLNDMAAAEDETVRVSGASDLPVTAATLILTDDDDASVATAWLARFGRTSASHVVDAVGERLRGASGQRNQVTAGGQRLLGESGAPGGLATFAQGLFGAAAPGGGVPTVTRTTGGQGQFGAAGPGGPLALGAATMGLQTSSAMQATAHDRGRPGSVFPVGRFPSMTSRNLLSQSSFHLSSAQDADSGDAAGRGARWAAWGRGAVTRFDGGEGALSLDGDVVTGTAGVDYAQGRLLAGLAVAHSVGDGTFAAPGIGETATNAGELGSSLTSGHPYLGLAVSERLSLWGLFGFGQGEMSLSDGDALTETDIAMRMGAVGLRRELRSGPDGFDLAVNSDVFLVRMTSDAAAGQAAAIANATRLRVALESGFGWTLASGGVVTPTLEVGLRYDDGDAERGTGVELGGGVRYADAARGLTMEATARTLLVHQASGFREWGAGGSLQVDPGASGRGLALGLRSSVGPTASGVERLWSQRDLSTLAGPRQGRIGARGRLEAELRYGLRVPGSRARLSPYGALSQADGVRAYGLGSRVNLGRFLSVSLEASRYEHAGGAPYHGVLLRGHLLR